MVYVYVHHQLNNKILPLYDHFLAFHQLNRASAMKLVKAMMKNENGSQRILFRPDEQVLNETAYVSCPLSNYNAVLPHQERIPHTPCQSTVKLRYLTGTFYVMYII